MSLDEQLGKLREIFDNAEKLPMDDKDKAKVYFMLNRAMLIVAEVSTDASGKGMINQIDDIAKLAYEAKRYSERAKQLDPTESYLTRG